MKFLRISGAHASYIFKHTHFFSFSLSGTRYPTKMRYSIIAVIGIVSSVSAISLDSLRSRDYDYCDDIGGSCQGNWAVCCSEKTGFAFCNQDDNTIDFQPCKFGCGLIRGIIDCTTPVPGPKMIRKDAEKYKF
jgi:hypothetical protein